MEGRLANQRCGRDPGGSARELSLEWRRGARWRARLCERPNKHRIAEANFFNGRGGAGGDHLRSQGGPLGWKSRRGEVAGPSGLEGEETAIRSAAQTRWRAIAIDHQYSWRGSEAAWGRSVGLEGRLANQRCGRNPDGSARELSLEWRRGARRRACLRERPNKHRIAEGNVFSARGGAGGDHLRSQGGPLGWKSRCREDTGPSALEGEETANRNAAHTQRCPVVISQEEFQRGSEAASCRSVELERRLAR